MKSAMDSRTDRIARWVADRKWGLFPLVILVPLFFTEVNHFVGGRDPFADLGGYAEVCVEIVALGCVAIYVCLMIDKRTKIVQTLSESEERYHELFELAPEPIVVHKDGTILLTNEAAAKSLGFDGAEDLIGKPLLDFVHPEFHAKVKEAIIAENEPDMPRMVEIPFIKADGSIVYGETTTRCTIYNGEPAFLSVGRDVTQRRLAEQALKESEEKHRLVVDNAREGIFIVQDGKLAFMNSRVPWFMKHGENEIERKPFIEFVLPEDREALIQQHVRRMQGDLSPWCHSLRVATKSGDIRWLELQTVAITWEGKPAALCFASDATKKRQAEEALRESEKRYRELVNNANDVIYVTDANGVFQVFNPVGLRLTGFSEEEVVKARYLDLIPPEYRKKVERFYGKQFVKKIPNTYFEFPICTKQGDTVWVGQHVQLVTEGEEITGFQAICRDITDRKIAEMALAMSEKRFRSLFECAADLIQILDPTGDILQVNPSTQELLNYTQEELAGRPAAELFDPESRKVFQEHLFPALKSETCRAELHMRCKDGMVLAVDCSGAPVRSEDGSLQYIVLTQRDITKRRLAENALRESEERFRAIFNSVPDSVFIKSRSGKYEFVNPAMLEVLALQPSDVLGRTEDEILGADVAIETRDLDQRVLNGDRVEEERRLTIGGAPMTFLETRVPLWNSGGLVTGICGIARNITERRHFEGGAIPLLARNLSKTMRATFQVAHLASGHDSMVLITGESGVGKDYLAKHIHTHSKRSKGPYFSINCAAVPLDLAESELFGHESGAFTGAGRRKRGLIELAEGGTLLLNEIGELSLPIQAKLLTFLDTKTFHRVGGERPIKVNVRLIAATSRHLEQEVADKRFRADLFYRLNVFSITIPPLRDRKEDIPGLVMVLIRELAAELRLPGVPEIGRGDIERLCSYSWPGNVRELRNVMERSLILARHNRIRLDEVLGEPELTPKAWSWTTTFPEGQSVDDVADELKSALIEEALRRSKGRRQAAADMLKISRDALKRRLQSLGMANGRKSEKRFPGG